MLLSRLLQVWRNHLHIIERLLAEGASVDAQDGESGWCALDLSSIILLFYGGFLWRSQQGTSAQIKHYQVTCAQHGSHAFSIPQYKTSVRAGFSYSACFTDF